MSSRKDNFKVSGSFNIEIFYKPCSEEVSVATQTFQFTGNEKTMKSNTGLWF